MSAAVNSTSYISDKWEMIGAVIWEDNLTLLQLKSKLNGGSENYHDEYTCTGV